MNTCQVSDALRSAVCTFLNGYIPVPAGSHWNGHDRTSKNVQAMQKFGAEREQAMLHFHSPAKNYAYSHDDCERYDHFQAILIAIAEDRPVRKESLKILRQTTAVFAPFIKYCEHASAEAQNYYSKTPENIERTPENLARWKKVARAILNNEKQDRSKTMLEHIERKLPKAAYEQLLNGDVETFHRLLTSRCTSYRAAMLANKECSDGTVLLLKHLRDKSAAICAQAQLDSLFSSEKRER